MVSCLRYPSRYPSYFLFVLCVELMTDPSVVDDTREVPPSLEPVATLDPGTGLLQLEKLRSPQWIRSPQSRPLQPARLGASLTASRTENAVRKHELHRGMLVNQGKGGKIQMALRKSGECVQWTRS